MTETLKSFYISVIRSLSRGLRKIRVLALLERRKGRTALWVRSLFSIYDVEDLIHLDLPWWTFDAIKFTDDFLASRGGARVFEYGAGASTVWLARRAASVTSVEHDLHFANSMGPTFGRHSNISLHVIQPGAPSDSGKARSNRKGYENAGFDDYVSAIGKVPGSFDLIVIDGRARVACLEKAIERLAPDGIILFDNSDRAEYREAIESCGLKEDKMRSLTPALPLPDQTSILRFR
jgi:hypothetical protein